MLKRFAISAFALLLSCAAASAASCYVGEFAQTGGAFVQVARQPGVKDQAAIAVSGTSAQSAAFNTNTTFIRINCDAVVSFLFGGNPTATSDNARLPTGVVEYFQVIAGQKVAFVTNN